MKSKNIYNLPIKNYSSAVSDKRAHFGVLEHAIDFSAPEGTEVFAAQEGTVIDLKQDSQEGGNDEKYVDKNNFILIEHENEELTQYGHLKYQGVFVKVGDKVVAGQKIGLSGNTGWSTEPHLHFHVSKRNDSEIGWETIEPQFKQELKITRL